MLTVRQFTGGRTARLAFVLSLIPALFAAIYVARPWDITPNEFAIDLFRELIVPTLLPIVVLLPATAAFGNELEDGTLPYLADEAGQSVAAGPGQVRGGAAGHRAGVARRAGGDDADRGQGPDAGDLGRVLAAMAGASTAAAALLGAVFLLVSLVIPRALLAGMIYIFAWESLLGRFLPGVRAISSREYALRVFDGILDDDFPTASNAALTMLVVAVVCLLLAVWRLRSIQID